MLPTHLGLDMAVDKFFFSLGMLTFTTHYKQFCGVCYVLYPSHRNAKIWGCFSTPKHLLVFGLAGGLPWLHSYSKEIA